MIQSLGTLQGVLVVLLLAVFLAQLLAPAVDAAQRRLLVGRRRRPLSRPWVILGVYVALFAAGTMAWLALSPRVIAQMQAAPATIDSMLAGTTQAVAELERLFLRLPLPRALKRAGSRAAATFLRDIDRDARDAVRDLGRARAFGWALAVVPVLAFVLLNNAPAFRRSALRALPHGHLQWRAEEYLRDVNSALAGYLRAQLAAGVIVAFVCLFGFSLLRVPFAGALGVAAGVLELIPVIGPLMVGLMAIGQAGPAAPAVVIFLVALRIVQDYAVYPRLIRHGMHLSSLAVIVTVWIGAWLGGAVGVLLAIPAAGFLSVSVRHWREYHAIEKLVRAAGDRH